MNKIKFLALLAIIILASCASRKNAIEQETAMVGMVNKPAMAPLLTGKNEGALQSYNKFEKEPNKAKSSETTNADKPAPNNIAANKSTAKASSFSQMKEMVKNGDMVMSKKDLKILNKLDKLSQNNFNNRREGGFEWTPTAKIIGGVGAASLLISLFTGSWFFAFLFIVAALAFICRWIGIIEF